MEIEVLNSKDQRCDDFVRGHPEAKLGHLPAWSRLVVQRIGHRPFYLVAREGTEIHGVLPLTQVRSRLFGNRMISQAFYTYGGPLAGNQTVIEALYHRATELAAAQGCETIEFRNIKPLPYDLHLRENKIAMHLSLTSDVDALWSGLKSEIRNRVRKAEKAGITVTVGQTELLDYFYNVWTVRMRQLGTPPYPRQLMRLVLQTFPQDSWIFLVRLQNRTIGGGLTTCFNGFADMQWVATLPQYNKIAPNSLLHWSVIKHHSERQARCFDFGRCTAEGPTYEFKRRWGCHPVQLCYQYWLRSGQNFSLATPDNPRYNKKIELWKKLPLRLTRIIGPYLGRNLP